MSDIPEKFLVGKSKIVLSEVEKEAMRTNVIDFVANNPVPVGTGGISSGSMSILQTLISTSYMPIVLVLALLLGGGTSYAAEGAVPGSVMYSVKTGINENVRALFTVGDEANANWEARLVERRLEESNELEALGKLDAEVESELALEVEKHAEKSEENIAKLEADGKSKEAELARARLSQALAVHIEMQSGDRVDSAIDNTSSGALEVRLKENAISDVVNKLEVRIGAPTNKIETELESETNTEVDSNSNVESESSVNGDEDSRSGEANVEAETTIKIETKTETQTETRNTNNSGSVNSSTGVNL